MSQKVTELKLLDEYVELCFSGMQTTAAAKEDIARTFGFARYRLVRPIQELGRAVKELIK